MVEVWFKFCKKRVASNFHGQTKFHRKLGKSRKVLLLLWGNDINDRIFLSCAYILNLFWSKNEQKHVKTANLQEVRKTFQSLPYDFYVKINSYLSRMKSCLWWWSCYHYSLAKRHISHRIHMFLATLSIICKCGISGIGCLSIWCASGRGFLFQASATYQSL